MSCYYRIDIQTVCGQPVNDERHRDWRGGKPSATLHPVHAATSAEAPALQLRANGYQ